MTRFWTPWALSYVTKSTLSNLFCYSAEAVPAKSKIQQSTSPTSSSAAECLFTAHSTDRVEGAAGRPSNGPGGQDPTLILLDLDHLTAS